MATPTKPYRLWCLIMHDDHTFPIQATSDMIVDDLKELIKKKLDPKFADVAAPDLALWKVDLDVKEGELSELLPSRDAQGGGRLISKENISIHFPEGPIESHLHLLVEPPLEWLLRHPKHSPKCDFDEIQVVLKEFEQRNGERMINHIQNNTRLPLWQSEVGTDRIRHHIRDLQLPATSDLSPAPSLLLHRLGHPSHDPKLQTRVDDVFRPDGSTFICNTSGSGKTRLIFEGLTRHWGLYFSARTEPEGIGSSDLEKTLPLLGSRLEPLPDQSDAKRVAVLSSNRQVAARFLLRVLLARLFVFHLFLQFVSATLNGIEERHKEMWLLLQLSSKTLLGEDLFLSLTRALAGATQEALNNAIRAEIKAIHRLLPSQPLFCVLDEAQIPASLFTGFFLSDTDPAQPRPILREILIEYSDNIPDLIISGTGLSMQNMETLIGSVVAKEQGPPPRTFTELGAFDGGDDQWNYLCHYFPPGFLETTEGNFLASRLQYWLRGRYRFTALYISHLIRAGFQSPHRVLDDLVQAMTQFRPTDGVNEETLVSIPKGIYGFDLSKLSKDSALLRQVAGVIFDYVFTANPRSMGSPEGEKLVEYGISRFGWTDDPSSRLVVTDEPVALLAACNYFSTTTCWNLSHFITEGMTSAHGSVRGIAFEYLVAYLLAMAFKSPKPMSQVFDFIGAPDLKDMDAQLVAIENVDEHFQYHDIDISSSPGPTYILGHTAHTELETLEWFKNPQRTAFLFPAHTVGPDLVLVLRLSDQSVVRVLVQCKHLGSPRIGPNDTEDAFKTTDPRQLRSRRNSKPSKPTDMGSKLQERLRSLGQGTAIAGTFGVLRVLVGYPSEPHMGTLQTLVANDSDGHPAATVNVLNLANDDASRGILLSLRKAVDGRAALRKRKLDDGVDTSNGKRRHS